MPSILYIEMWTPVLRLIFRERVTSGVITNHNRPRPVARRWNIEFVDVSRLRITAPVDVWKYPCRTHTCWNPRIAFRLIKCALTTCSRRRQVRRSTTAVCVVDEYRGGTRLHIIRMETLHREVEHPLHPVEHPGTHHRDKRPVRSPQHLTRMKIDRSDPVMRGLIPERMAIRRHDDLVAVGGTDRHLNQGLVTLTHDHIGHGIESGQPLSEGQATFMRHELTEADLMDQGMPYEQAHDRTLTMHPPGRNYDLDVIDQFPEFGPWWRNMNGLGPR